MKGAPDLALLLLRLSGLGLALDHGAAFLAILIAGPGRYALDARLARRGGR
jgi:hypothetical protein